MNTKEYIEYLIQQQLNNQQQNGSPSLSNGLNKIDKFGGNLKMAGDYLSGFDNKFTNALGNGMSNIGSTLQGGVSTVRNFPQNTFKGFAQPTNPAIESALSNALSNTGANASMGAVGNAVAENAGSSLAGVGSTIGAETAGASAGVGAGAGASAGGASGAMAGGPIGALVALGAMAINGANRKRAKQSGENLMNQTNKLAKTVENDTSTQDFANNMVQQAQNNIANGVATGGASPIEPDVVGLDNEMSQLGYTPQQKMSAMNGLNGGDKTIASLVDKYNIQKPQADIPVEAPADTTDVQAGGIEKTKQSLLSKFMNGIGDFAQGYQENRNNAFSPDNVNQDRFAEQTTTYTPSQQLADYQNALRNKGIDENIVNAVAQGKNSGNKDIDAWIKANPEALKPVANTQTTYTGKEKGKMARFGEGVGTIARALQKPAVQGLVAGGLGTMLTGNPLYGLGLGYKFANQRAMSDAYRDVLKQNGVNVPDTGTFGNITNQDMGTIGRLAESRAYHDAMMHRYDLDRDLRRIIAENNDRHKEVQDKIAQQNADSKRISAQASQTRADKVGQGGGNGGKKGGATKPEQHPDFNSDLAGYVQRMNDPRYATKTEQMRASFIKKYGKDPDKLIK